MTEINNSTQSDCRRIGYVEENGQIVRAEFMIVRDGTSYSMDVALPDYIERLEESNKNLDPNLGDDNYMPHEGPLDEDQVCRRLANVPIEKLKPYLTEQNPPDSPTTE